jgi:hypothetical protein
VAYIPPAGTNRDAEKKIINPLRVSKLEDAKAFNYNKLPSRPVCVCGIEHKADKRGPHCVLISSGVATMRTRLEPYDVVIGMVQGDATNGYKDCSIRVLNQEPGDSFGDVFKC